MSIPSISGLAGVGLVPSSTGGTTATDEERVRKSGDKAAADTDTSSSAATVAEAGYKTLTPPRFPWLSRLSEQLSAAAKSKPAFPSAPVLGDNVDKSA